MKRMLTSKVEQAKRFLENCNPETVEYVKEFKEETDNLVVVQSNGYDFVEVDPSDAIEDIKFRYIEFGIDEDLLHELDEFDSIYEALCIVEDGQE